MCINQTKTLKDTKFIEKFVQNIFLSKFCSVINEIHCTQPYKIINFIKNQIKLENLF